MIIYLLTSVGQAFALDLGTYSNTFAIQEVDLLEQIKAQLNQGNIEEFQQQYAEEVRHQIDRPNRVKGITKAEKDASRQFDPTVLLAEDIVVPDEVTGINKILYPKGTKINPLDYDNFDPLIFIDPDDDMQVAMAHNYHDSNELSRIILINGKPGNKQVGNKEYYYYFDQGGVYSARFGLNKVPAIVYQEPGAKVLTITEVLLK